jgi:hypothetical protein
MFIEHKQLKVLSVPASKVARLNSSGCNVQMAFPGFPPQMCASYLVSLTSGDKVLVVVAFYLSESRQSIFFIPNRGEVPVEEAEQTFEQGFVFAESMGFVLNETDYHLLSAVDQQKLWSSLPICRLEPAQAASQEAATSDAASAGGPKTDPLDEYRERSLKSLGRFLSSM